MWRTCKQYLDSWYICKDIWWQCLCCAWQVFMPFEQSRMTEIVTRISSESIRWPCYMGKKLIYLKLSACVERICETMADLNREFLNNTEWCLRMDQQLWTELGSVLLDKFRSSVKSCFDFLNWLRHWAGARRSPRIVLEWVMNLSYDTWYLSDGFLCYGLFNTLQTRHVYQIHITCAWQGLCHGLGWSIAWIWTCLGLVSWFGCSRCLI
jgi:hypothetical protein